MKEQTLRKSEKYTMYTEIDRAPVTISQELGWIDIEVTEKTGSFWKPYKTTKLSFTETDAKLIAAAIDQLTKAVERLK
jgi:hypothetical protein